MLTPKRNRTNKFFLFPSARHQKNVMTWQAPSSVDLMSPACLYTRDCKAGLRQWPGHVCESAGRIGSSGHPPPAAGKHRVGEPAEKTGEFLQHFCWRVQPQPTAGSPRTHGCRVPPFVLQGPEEWTEDVTSAGEGDCSACAEKKLLKWKWWKFRYNKLLFLSETS